MSFDTTGLQSELQDAGQAIGVIGSEGGLNPDWFNRPGYYLEQILKDQNQRQALVKALEGLLPSDPKAPTAGGSERWHPLLPSDQDFNVYVVVDGDGSAKTTVEAAVGVQGPKANLGDATKPSARLSVRMPLLSADAGGLTPLAGTAAGPIGAELRVVIGLQRTSGGSPIGLEAVGVTVALALDQTPSVHIVLEGLDLGDGVQPTVTLDPADLGGEASHVVVGLLRSTLADQSWMTGALQSLANGLPGVLGLVDGIPPLPIADLLHDPTAFKGWLLQLITPPSGGGAAPVVAWLGQLATLIGVSAPVVNGSGTPTDPWRVAIAEVGVARLEARFAVDHDPKTGADRLLPGLAVGLAPTVAGTKAEVQASATLAAIPLAGTATAVPVPAARLLIVTPTDGSTLVSGAGVTIGSARGGISWDGTKVAPLLELDGVTYGPLNNQTVDLTSATSVENAAESAVRAAIQNLVGTSGPGEALCVLLGVEPPPGATSWPSTSLADLPGFAAHPLAEIGAVHRRVLGTPAPNDWGQMLAQVAALIGVTATVHGTGAADDPWRAVLAQAGPLSVDVTAWDDRDGTTHRLRIGLRAGVDTGPLHAAWQCALVGFDLPASDGATARFLGAQRLGLSISPVPSLPEVGGVAVAAQTFDVSVQWQAGSPVKGLAEITGVTVAGDGLNVDVGTISFPAPPGTAANPLAGLGVSATAVEGLLRVLALRAAAAWGGEAVSAVASLLGVGATLPDLPAEWPRLGDPARPGALFEHPLAALQTWWSDVLTTLTADGTALGIVWARWVGQLLQGAVAGVSTGAPVVTVPPATGAGTPGDPWTIGAGSGIEGLLWLDPAPPASWLNAATTALAAATNFADVVERAGAVGRFDDALGEATGGIDTGVAGAGLSALAGWLSTSDGVVPLASQQPAAAGWASGGPPVNAAHPDIPSDAGAVAQILAALGGVASTTPVLCISAPFGSAGDWQLLIGGTPDPAAHLDFRQPGVPPTGVDLTTVTATGRFYTCDLNDDGSGDRAAQVIQVTRAMQRVSALHSNGPVAVVAHSTSALAALAAIQAAPAGTANALVTVGAPLAGSPLTALADAGVAGAVRLIRNLVPAGLPDTGLQQAIAHLAVGLDGFRPPASGSTPIPVPYPTASFQHPPALDLPAGVAGTTVASVLTGDLLASAKAAIQAATSGITPPANPPTHAGAGLRAHLAAGGTPGGPAVDVWIETELGRVPLGPSVAPSEMQAGLKIRAALTNQGGWLVGGPDIAGATAAGARIRWAEIGVDIAPPSSPGGPPVVTPHLVLHDAGIRAPLRPRAVLTDADAGSLLGEVLRALSAAPAGSPVGGLLDALTALGLAVPDGHGGTGVAADGLAALVADPVGFIGPKLAGALSLGILGFIGAPRGPWTCSAGPIAIEISADPWTLHVTTGAGGLELGGLTLSADIGASLPDLRPAADISLAAGPITATLSRPAGGPLQVALDAPPWTSNTSLVPAAPDLAGQALEILPRLALSSAAAAVVDSLVGPQINTGPIDALLADFGQWLRRPGAMGASSAGGGGGPAGFDGTRIANLLTTIGAAAGLPPAPTGTGVTLPGGLALTVSGGDPLLVSLRATGIGGGILDIGGDLAIDRLGHATPDGTATLHLTLPGSWGTLAIDLGAGPSGLTLSLTPGSGAPITLLPSVSGLEAVLAGLGTALLPALLDAALPHLSSSPITDDVLKFTAALNLSDPTGNFSGHAATWIQVAQPGWLEGLRTSVPAAALSALATIVTNHFAPSGVTATSDSASVTVTITTGGSSHVAVKAGWDGSGPTVTLGINDFAPGGSPIELGGTLGYADGQLTCSLDLAVAPLPDLPITFTPALSLSITGGAAFNVSLLPFGAAGAGQLAIEIAPQPGLSPSPPNLTLLATQWLLPVVADLVTSALWDDIHTKNLWSGGPTAEALLTTAGLVQPRPSPHAGQPSIQLVPDLDLSTAPFKVLQAASALSIDIPPHLTLSLASDSGRLGLRLKGYIDLPTGSLDVRALFGGPNGQPGPDSGVTLYVLDISDANHPKLHPSLHVVGLGVGLLGQQGAPLVDLSQFTMGGVEGYLFFDVDFLNASSQPAISVTNVGAGVELDQIGVPLAIAGQASSGGNPVAQNMVAGGGGGSGSGDSRPANPGVSVSAYDRSGTVSIQFSGATSIAIPVHQSFGPLHLEQVEIDVSGSDVGIGLDGGLTLAGLTVDVIDLAVSIPLRTLLHPDTWSLDLRGLAASLDEPGIAIAGGLLKSATTPVEYDGMLSASIVDLGGITVVGSYAKPTDAQGGYTSLFVFVALDIPLGGPPFLFILGLGGGVGINRELIVPDITGVETFVLVKAIDDNSLANDPMSALLQMGQLMPPRRGAYWIAAGLHFSTFALVTTTAVVYVSLDRGVEVGVLGLSRMALPDSDVALVSIELALKARYSTAEQLLSIQAQLTDNSWLFYKDCQLTGGFAFFMWFAKAQFVLTLGGYHPAFQPPDGFPTVPRLGFHWQVSSLIVIKGEAYFALTTSCVMAGGRLEAVFDAGFVRAWFDAHADFLVAWDPFAYNVDIGISVGVALQITICFFGCVTIGISLSVGADLAIAGPPFHGTVTVDLDVCSVTIPFGGPPAGPPPLSWADFSSKYIISGDPAGTAVDAAPTAGLIPADPPGAAPAPGDADHPWRMLPEWVFQVTSRAAAKAVTDVQTGDLLPAADVGEIDLAPMGSQYTNVDSSITITIEAQQPDGSWAAAAPAAATVETAPVEAQMPEATWHYTDADSRKASARTITAVTGATITGHASLPNPGADIHIATLVDDLPAFAKPLPLDPGNSVITLLRGYGLNAGELQAIGAPATTPALLDAAGRLLSGPLSESARQALGFSGTGMAPMSVRALQRFRSSPPVITPLAAGLDMRPVDVPPAPPSVATPPALAEPLRAPRIKAVLESRPRPASSTPPPVRTTVRNVAAAAKAPRTSPPRPPVLAGARLITVPLPGAPRPTALAAAGRWRRTTELGTPTSAAAAAAAATEEAALTGGGLTIDAGASYVIELPAGAGTLEITGDAGRVTLLDRGGRVLVDREGSGNWSLPVPTGAALVVAGCMGVAAPPMNGRTKEVAGATGTLTSQQSPAGSVPACGWTAGNLLPLVAAQTLLGRGAWIVLDRPHPTRQDRVETHVAMVRAAHALDGTSGAETWMPAGVSCVAVLLDQTDPTAAWNGDLAVAAAGATLSARPLRIGGGRRLALLYDVEPGSDGPGGAIGITAASRAGWRLAGVAGLPGRAAEWAARWHGQVPEHLVPDGPLSPDGRVTVRYTGGTGQ